MSGIGKSSPLIVQAVRRLLSGSHLTLTDAVPAALSLLLYYQFLTLPAFGEEDLPGFEAPNAQARKNEFIDYLAPIVASVNDSIEIDRSRIRQIRETLENDGSISVLDRWWLDQMAERYAVAEEPGEPLTVEIVIQRLLRRVDIVPQSLVLVQAAMESGWGTSRFAQEGNNLFGQRCFDAGCGIVPAQRVQAARFEVATFDSVRSAVESYILNINRHPFHRPLRLLRESLRAAGERIDGMTLAQGLENYSERGKQYVGEIQSLIRQNGLDRRDFGR